MDYSFLPFNKLIDALNTDKNYVANYELAQRVVKNHKSAINYYIGVLSLPIISHIERNIIHRDILSEFYEFLSEPYNTDSNWPEWHKVALYKGVSCRLDSYTSLITTRYFCKIANKEREKEQSKYDLVEYVDYQSLLCCAENDESQDYIVGSKLWRAHKAYESLCERDQLVILYLVIEKKSALEAWPLLEQYIKPRKKGDMSSEDIKSLWTNKQKQDGLSLIKGRAINTFIELYNRL